MSPGEKQALREFIQQELKLGRIRKSESEMAAPVFFIKKKDGSLRFVQDYRALNAVTIKNKYPIPLSLELVDQLREARYFTHLAMDSVIPIISDRDYMNGSRKEMERGS